jgi:hypothetical protein
MALQAVLREHERYRMENGARHAAAQTSSFLKHTAMQ